VTDGDPISPIHPMVVGAPAGFIDGPVTSRVAVVDVDAATGSLRPPAILIPEKGIYRGVGEYDVKTPYVKGVQRTYQLGGVDDRLDVADLSSVSISGAFIKVSAFGTVLRTIGFVEHPAVLGRHVTWAFDGPQLLVVPLAGTLDNAFYHRASRSLQFYSFPSPEHGGQMVHTALSQDIVSHEATHALVDGIAPDLYSSTDPESLAIHEAVADLTAVLLSLRNRELGGRTRPTLAQHVAAVQASSRYSQIAEEFGRARGQRQGLRDAHNRLGFVPSPADDVGIADRTSPYAAAEVLVGAFYSVLAKAIHATASAMGDSWERGSSDLGFRESVILATNRVGSMVFKGLDWLPPGDASLRDFVAAILQADRFALPEEGRERSWLIEECASRGIATAAELKAAVRRSPAWRGMSVGPEVKDIRRLVKSNGRALGVPDGIQPSVTVQAGGIPVPRGSKRPDVKDAVELERKYLSERQPVRLIRLAWWESVPIELGNEFPDRCDVKRGTTIAVDEAGAIVAVLRGGRDSHATGRQVFLHRLADGGSLQPPVGPPDRTGGRPAMRTTLADGALRVEGGFEALHVADAFLD
jgi:hypothetical protein